MSDAESPQTRDARPALEPHIDPSRAWILGLYVDSDGKVGGPGLGHWNEAPTCTCQDLCDIDHEYD